MPVLGSFNPYQGTPNTVALAPGQMWTLGPEAGLYQVTLSPYHTIQYFDPNMAVWRSMGSAGEGGAANTLFSDGNAVRIVNQTGCAVGALLTNAGSGYTSAPTVTASAGGSMWRAIVGGAVSTSVTIISGGAGYTYPPRVVIDAPQRGGIQATAVATLSSGAVSAVTIVDQGAGYVSTPNIAFVNDPREVENPAVTAGYGASAALTLTGAQTVTGVLCTNVGSAAVSSLPTLSFSGGGGSSAAATTIMNWTVTNAAIGTAGAGLSGAFARVIGEDAFPTTSPAYTNPTSQANLVTLRNADIRFAVSAGALSGSPRIVDGGCFTSAPTPLVTANASQVTTPPVVTFTMGGANGVSFVSRVA